MSTKQHVADFLIKQLDSNHEVTSVEAGQHVEHMLAEIRRKSEKSASPEVITLPMHQAFCIAHYAMQNNPDTLSRYNLEMCTWAWVHHQLFNQREEVRFSRAIIAFAEEHEHKYGVIGPDRSLRYGAYDTAVEMLRYWCQFLEPVDDLEPVWSFMDALNLISPQNPRLEDLHLKAWQVFVERYATKVEASLEEPG